MTSLVLTIRHEYPSDYDAIERMHERAFGPGRFARTAYRLREGAPPVADLSYCALVGTLIVGSVRLTPVRAGDAPALVLGPLTVEPAFKDRGIGAALMQTSLDAAKQAGHRLVVLVGDEPYYRRFGFRVVPAGRLILPGPVDPARFLYCELGEGAFEAAQGAVRALPAAA
ncbi:putative N-acetyltransferase YhbS [Pseudochelatococcus lubricantis]|uniref:N-acetyltransferase YhbS n=1 Tax=Pseudochelatococcus lubricantis TaxID=1538102 RepID=A0ABX0V0M2_9HYPH|nr:N-acetyltransferase [Pseudochelatococcus lubricantis]NIJ57705.1 putative N-acetyltransferase YhbS [Pseudochelatococcus lubricantis]